MPCHYPLARAIVIAMLQAHTLLHAIVCFKSIAEQIGWGVYVYVGMWLSAADAAGVHSVTACRQQTLRSAAQWNNSH